jgi:signal transduction histidine kinase
MYHCIELINNVKTLRRLKTEQLRVENADPGEIIAEAVRDYPKDPAREVTIDYVLPQNCNIIANPLLKEVFTNLISNSVKHSQGAGQSLDHGRLSHGKGQKILRGSRRR